MKELKAIVSYCYDCIKNEDILEKDISIKVRSKAVLYPFDNDPFIFSSRVDKVNVSAIEKLVNFHEYTSTRDYEIYYGYPLLFYFNEDREIYVLAPLFVLEVRFTRINDDLFIEKAEHMPSCGLQALNRLGLRSEEIAEIGSKISSLFKSNVVNQTELVKRCIKTILDETSVNFNEPIDPSKLTNNQKLSNAMQGGLYNKSMIYAGDRRVFNLNLLQDLEELKRKDDLDKTSIAYLLKSDGIESIDNKALILPYPANEYQSQAIQSVFHNKLTVITGPPGTGKSQFIMNLLINLFHYGKSVLFVSHTNEAVNVVSDKLNEDFKNFVIRTGRKAYRQELKGKFNDLLIEARKKNDREYDFGRIKEIWKLIEKCRKQLMTLDKLEQKYDEDISIYHHKKNATFGDNDIESTFGELTLKFRRISKLQNKILHIQHSAEKKEKKQPNLYKSRKKQKLLSKLVNKFPIASYVIFYETNKRRKDSNGMKFCGVSYRRI